MFFVKIVIIHAYGSFFYESHANSKSDVLEFSENYFTAYILKIY